MNDRVTGSLLLTAAVAILILYAYGIFFAGSSIAILVLQITAFVGVAALLGLVGWIGYSIATTAPPPPPEPETEPPVKEEVSPTEPSPSSPAESEKTVRKPSKRKVKPTPK